MNVLKIEQYRKNINLYSDSNDDMSNSHHTGLSQFNIIISKKKSNSGAELTPALVSDQISYCMTQ